MKPILSQERIHELYAAAVQTGLILRRDGLMSGLNKHFVAGLPRSPSPNEQLLADLNELNKVRALDDGSSPFIDWLRAALTLVGPLPERRVFGAAFAQVRAAVGDTEPRPEDVTPPTTSSHAAPPFEAARPIHYPWHEDAGVALHDLFMNAYDNVRTARHFLATVPVQTNMIGDGAIYPFWADVLNEAAKQGKLQRLVERALSDNRISAYHPRIERAARALGLGPGQAAF